MTRLSRHEQFQQLHTLAEPFVIPNPWDAGSARLLAGMGFTALATSSGAAASALARRDGQITRDEALAHARAIAEAVTIPVSVDLENGFSANPVTVAETIRLAAGVGLSGGSIEDASGDPTLPIYELSHAVERIAAAVEAVRSLGRPFVLTARAENFSRGINDLDDTIRRLVAFEQAGADVLFAPGLPDLAAVRAVCSAVNKPVNYMIGIKGRSFPLADLAAVGVRRISLASSLYRAAMSGLLAAAREVRARGTFEYVENTVTTAELVALLDASSR